jgi:hypothetical protein
MAISSNNLYSGGYIYTFPDSTSVMVRNVFEYTAKDNDNIYTIREGDTLWQLAWWSYKRFRRDASKLWWILADVNNIENPLDISSLVGTQIVVPTLKNLGM